MIPLIVQKKINLWIITVLFQMSKPLFTVVEFLWKTCHWISWQFKRENVKRGHAWHHAASAWMITVPYSI